MHDLPELKPESARHDHSQMLRQLAINAAIGVGLGIAIGAALLWFDIGGLGMRIARSSTPWLATFILIAPIAMTFGGAVAGSFIMSMPYERRFRDRE